MKKLTYSQSSGQLRTASGTAGHGYSGRDAGLNNPALESIRAVGPIPRGLWLIGKPYDSRNVGPLTLPLYAVDGKTDDTHAPTGRSAFRVHGDNRKGDQSASHGCIILPRTVRQWIIDQGYTHIEVTI